MKIAICCLILLSACATIQRATLEGRIADAWTQISNKEYVRTRGIGVASHKTRGLTRRRGQSREAALTDARFHLLALLKGVRLSGGVTVAQLMERDSLVNEIANEVVSGGEEVLTEWTKDSGCVVTLELRRSTVERLIQEKSQREIGLEHRIAQDMVAIQALAQELAKALKSDVIKMDGCDIQAAREKAAHLESLESKLKAYPPGEYQGLYFLTAEIERTKEWNLKERAEAMRPNCDFPSQARWDKLEAQMRASGYYTDEQRRGRGEHW